MAGFGKKTAWKVWTSFPEIMKTLADLMKDPESLTIESDHTKNIEQFTVLMYSKGCGAASVNDIRTQLSSHGLRSLDNMSPTQAALFQHVKHSLLQASYIWKQSLNCHQNIPIPADWGWKLNSKQQWVPFWTVLTDANNTCTLLLHCRCTKGNSKYACAGLRCTSIYKCEG